MDACQFYRPGQLCRAGFPLGYPSSSACTGRACLSCGRPNEITPPCQDEDIDPRWLDDSGKPRFALQGVNHADAQPTTKERT